MPVGPCSEGGRPGYRCGQAGKCYTYPPGDDAARADAKQAAIDQCLAMDEEPAAEADTFLAELVAAMAKPVGEHDPTNEFVDVFLVPPVTAGAQLVEINRLAERGARRADQLEDHLIALIQPILVQAADEAARRFVELATLGAPVPVSAGGGTLTAAAADWTPPAADEVMDVDKLVKGLRTKTDPVRLAAIESVMGPILARHGITFDPANPHAAAILNNAGAKVTHIAKSTRENVRRSIIAAYAEGLSIDDTAKAIRRGMRRASWVRARMIARTELVGAVNGGSLAAVKIVDQETGQKHQKTWLTAPGARYPRHELYVGLDGQTVGLDEYFDVGGYDLYAPGDPNGPPEEVINCRCSLTYVDITDAPAPSEAVTDTGALLNLEQFIGAATPSEVDMVALADSLPYGTHDLGLATVERVRAEGRDWHLLRYYDDTAGRVLEQQYAEGETARLGRKLRDLVYQENAGRGAPWKGPEGQSLDDMPKKWADFYLSLSRVERGALGRYTGDEFADINAALRGEANPRGRFLANRILRVMERAPDLDPADLAGVDTLWRSGTVGKDVPFFRAEDYVRANLHVGDEISPAGGAFQSTAYAPANAIVAAEPGAPVLFELHGARRGLPAQPFTRHVTEREVMLDPAERFRITAIRKETFDVSGPLEKIVVEAERVPRAGEQARVTARPSGRVQEPAAAPGPGAADDLRAALDYYHSPESFRLNAALREGAELTAEQQNVVRALDHAFTPTTVDQRVYRGIVNLDEAFGVPDINSFIRRWQGAYYNTPAYTSTSASKTVAEDFSFGISGPDDVPVILRIDLPPGTNTLRVPAGPYGDQDEWLLPRGIQIKIEGVIDRNADLPVIVAHVEPPPVAKEAAVAEAPLPRSVVIGEDPWTMALPDDVAARIHELKLDLSYKELAASKSEMAQRLLRGADSTEDLYGREKGWAARDELHRRALAELFAGKVRSSDPTAMFTSGGAASGKGSVLRFRLGGQDLLVDELADRADTVVIDADWFKRRLPEYQALSEVKDPYASLAVHEESSFLAKEAIKLAQERGINFVLDGVGGGGPGNFVKKLAAAHDHGYRIQVGQVQIPTNQALVRMLARGDRPNTPNSGRYVADWALRDGHVSSARAHTEWRDLDFIDHWWLYDNSQDGVGATLVAEGRAGTYRVSDPALYRNILAKANEEKPEVSAKPVLSPTKPDVVIGESPWDAPLPPDVARRVEELGLETWPPTPTAFSDEVLRGAVDTEHLYARPPLPAAETRRLTSGENAWLSALKNDDAGLRVQEALQGGERAGAEQGIAAIDSAIAHSPKVARDTVFLRGVDLRHGPLNVGDIYTDPSYLFVAKNTPDGRELAELFSTGRGAVLELRVPAGTPVADLTRYAKAGDPNAEISIAGGESALQRGLHWAVVEADPEHRRYVLELVGQREDLHARILQDVFAGKVRSNQPTAMFTSGGAASGKSALRFRIGGQDLTIKELAARPDTVVLDADAFKRQLPEYKTLAAVKDPYASAAVHEESSFLVKEATKLAQQRGINIVIDGVGAGPPGKFVGKLRAAHEAGYRVQVAQVQIPTNQAIERMIARGDRPDTPNSGRYVAMPPLREGHSGSARAHLEWRDLDYVDHWWLWDNSQEGFGARLVAQGQKGRWRVNDPAVYTKMVEKADEYAAVAQEAVPVALDAPSRSLGTRPWLHLKDNSLLRKTRETREQIRLAIVEQDRRRQGELNILLGELENERLIRRGIVSEPRPWGHLKDTSLKRKIRQTRNDIEGAASAGHADRLRDLLAQLERERDLRGGLRKRPGRPSERPIRPGAAAAGRIQEATDAASAQTFDPNQRTDVTALIRAAGQPGVLKAGQLYKASGGYKDVSLGGTYVARAGYVARIHDLPVFIEDVPFAGPNHATAVALNVERTMAEAFDAVPGAKEALLKNTKVIQIFEGNSPMDAVWTQQHGRPFVSAGTYGNSELALWKSGGIDIARGRPGTLYHEMGHGMGVHHGPPNRAAWEAAQEADAASSARLTVQRGYHHGYDLDSPWLVGDRNVTEYAKTNIREDWAESIELYLLDRTGRINFGRVEEAAPEIAGFERVTSRQLHFADLWPRRAELIDDWLSYGMIGF